ncbi:hypothetical protein [Paludisphaera rhizosphaerae]|uniref:hypothetical protein n=1 Tax=Paludisphaera rhizosphaerae TaxID=2711216 RepID=UPI0013EC5986|nr:hypothetical protein [Paludisphaera rhizosphaerae]
MTDADLTTEQRLERLDRVLRQLGRPCVGIGDTGDEPAAARAGLPNVGAGGATEFSLRDFLDSVDDLTAGQRRQFIDAYQRVIKVANLYIDGCRSMHAVAPIQRLKILAGRAEAISSAAFHVEMRAIFRSLCDLHIIDVGKLIAVSTLDST